MRANSSVVLIAPQPSRPKARPIGNPLEDVKPGFALDNRQIVCVGQFGAYGLFRLFGFVFVLLIFIIISFIEGVIGTLSGTF